MSAQQASAECRENKHPYCHGKAWDAAADELASCLCDCHVGEESQVQPPKVTVYVKTGHCNQCDNTLRKLKAMGVAFQVKTVDPEQDRAYVDELRFLAKQLGVAPSMPYVEVVAATPDESTSWFGFRPDKLEALKKEAAA